ncbi:MAG: T9SS type A sorting domain-containing protein, partial [Candidatus Promineifilaceae bacterium]
GTPLGTPLSSTLSVQNSLTESSLANNTWTTNSIVVGSYDPNDKIATTSSGLSTEYFYIDGDEWIDYTIRFQNTGTDTAFTVVVTDTLSPVLDMASFQQGVASHSFVVSFRAGRVVEWRFENILLPDSNVNETSSHGLVNFRVKPQLPLFPGTTIENTANIYFDFNDPVITEPSVLVAEFSTGVGEQVNGAQLLVMPNPTEGRLMVRRSGDDLRPGMLVVRGIDGRTMLEQRMLGSSAMLNMEALAAGVYMLEHVTDNGSRTTVRFVKQ